MSREFTLALRFIAGAPLAARPGAAAMILVLAALLGGCGIKGPLRLPPPPAPPAAAAMPPAPTTAEPARPVPPPATTVSPAPPPAKP